MSHGVGYIQCVNSLLEYIRGWWEDAADKMEEVDMDENDIYANFQR